MPVACSYCDVSELEDPTLMAQALNLLPWPERRHKAARYRFAADQRLCVGAGLLAASMLRRAGARDLTLKYSAQGKPSLAHHPNLHFNLSHSGTLAVCAVSDEPVGVDVETICNHGDEVARYCYQPKELDWLSQAPDRAQAFTRLWVRKESYIKLTGTGLSREPRSFSVLPGQPIENDVAFAEFLICDALLCVCTFEKREIGLAKWSLLEAL